jgi:hypothetical protein
MTGKMTAKRVVLALMQQPGLLRRVRLLLLDVKGAGPWLNTGKRFGDRDQKNVWGLPRFPHGKREEKLQQEHPKDMSFQASGTGTWTQATRSTMALASSPAGPRPSSLHRSTSPILGG